MRSLVLKQNQEALLAVTPRWEKQKSCNGRHRELDVSARGVSPGETQTNRSDSHVPINGIVLSWIWHAYLLCYQPPTPILVAQQLYSRVQSKDEWGEQMISFRIKCPRGRVILSTPPPADEDQPCDELTPPGVAEPSILHFALPCTEPSANVLRS